jgi:hypothetical protein
VAERDPFDRGLQDGGAFFGGARTVELLLQERLEDAVGGFAHPFGDGAVGLAATLRVGAGETHGILRSIVL